MTENEYKAAKVLIVDDQESNITLLTDLLGARGFCVTGAQSGEAALEAIEHDEPDVMLLDVVMPGLDGYEVCRRIKQDTATRHLPVVLISGANADEANIQALEAGADEFVQRPFNIVFLEARIRSCVRTKHLNDQIREYQRRLEDQNVILESRVQERTSQLVRTQYATVFSLAKLAESRDPETGEHLNRIRRYTQEICLYLADRPAYRDVVDSAFIQTLYNSSPLHDIGKVGIPDRILLKRGVLNDRERAIMRSHPIIGGETLAAAERESGHNPLLAMGREIAFGHHEWWDGSGYPKGLAGTAIPLSARIVALADVYDALRSKRPYKDAFSHDTAREIILEGRGSHFDPDVVDAFLAREARFRCIHDDHMDGVASSRIEQILEALDPVHHHPLHSADDIDTLH